MNDKSNARTGSYVLSMASEGITRLIFFFDVKSKLIGYLERHDRALHKFLRHRFCCCFFLQIVSCSYKSSSKDDIKSSPSNDELIHLERLIFFLQCQIESDNNNNNVQICRSLKTKRSSIEWLEQHLI